MGGCEQRGATLFLLTCPLQVGLSLDLPADTSPHIQVLRLQPGDDLTLFNGLGGSHTACVLHMGRHTVEVEVLTARPG